MATSFLQNNNNIKKKKNGSWALSAGAGPGEPGLGEPWGEYGYFSSPWFRIPFSVSAAAQMHREADTIGLGAYMFIKRELAK